MKFHLRSALDIGLPSRTEIFGRFFSKLHSLQSVTTGFVRIFEKANISQMFLAVTSFFTSHPGRNGCSHEEEKDSLSESCCQTSPMYPWWEYWTSEGRLSESWGEICQTSLWLESWLRDISISRYLERFCHMLVMGWVHVDTIMSALFVRNVIISRSLALIKVNQISGYQMKSHLDINRSLPRMIMCRRSL